jgi:hypothetical protein
MTNKAEITYRLMKLTPGQQCFGAGEWCVERITKEIICAAPDCGTARQIAENLARATAGTVKD